MSNVQNYDPKARTGLTCPRCGAMARVHRTMRCSVDGAEYVTRYFYCACKWRAKAVEVVLRRPKSA